jgi:eukaryotic-like serine/threonine-protein kinase
MESGQMTEPIARRVHQLLTQSMDIPNDQRRPFLHKACADDPRLINQVNRLLQAIDDSQSFLERPALESFAMEIWSSDRAMPESIGNYRIVRQLGSGGMGTVYEAIQGQPNRTVALKIPRRRLWNASQQTQLQYESEILGRLRHPNIAQVYEAGVDQTDPHSPIAFFAMEYVPGAKTLGQYLRERQLTVLEILAMFNQICDALQHGHRLGIIHRDLKPANILIDSDGNPKVIDFGVASSHEVHDRSIRNAKELETLDGAILQPQAAQAGKEPSVFLSFESPNGRSPRFGTLNYMSPEQCKAQEFLDARTDIYSLGVVLYEMLCDALPYDLRGLTTAQAMQVICEEPHREPRRSGKPLDRDLRAILDKTLTKDREQRYSTVDALAADLRRFVDGFPVSARPATLGYVGCRFIQRHSWLMIVTTLLMLAILAGILVSSVFAYQTSLESLRRREAEIRALNERDKALWQSYVANIAAGFSSYNNMSQLRYHVAATPEQFRDWEWHFLASAAESGERVIAAHHHMIHTLAVSENQTLAATGADDGCVRIWDTATWRMVIEIPHPAHRIQANALRQVHVTALAFRDDDQQIVVGMSDGSIRIWNAKTGNLVRELAGHDQLVSSLSVHPDGTIASACRGNRGRLWDGKSMKWLREINDEQQSIQGVAFCDQGNLLLTWEPSGSIWLRDSETCTVKGSVQLSGNLRRVAVNSDSSLIAAGGNDNRIHLFRIAQLENALAHEQGVLPNTKSRENPVVFTLPGNQSSTESLCFAADGTAIAVGRADRRIEVFAVETAATVARLRGHDDFVSGVWLNPSGDQLVSVSGDGTIRLWPLSEDPQLGNIATNEQRDERIYDFAFSPDGTRITSAGDKNIRLWQLDLQSYTDPITGHTGSMYAVAWSPDGKVLAASGADGIIRIAEIESGVTRELSRPDAQAIQSLAFSRDGQTLVAADTSGSIRIWNIVANDSESGGGVELSDDQGKSAHQAAINQVRFSRDGRLLASASSDRTVRVWDFDKRKLLQTLKGHHLSDIFAVVFSPDGDLLYSGSRDRTIGIWSLETGRLAGTLNDHGQPIRCLDINPSGTRLVAGSWFGEVLIWDRQQQEPLASFTAHVDIVHAIKFDPTGQILATCSVDQALRIHEGRAQP